MLQDFLHHCNVCHHARPTRVLDTFGVQDGSNQHFKVHGKEQGFRGIQIHVLFINLLAFALSVDLWDLFPAHEPRWSRVFATQHVRSFERGSLEVRGNDWVVASAGGRSLVGRVGEIIEFAAAGGSFVRLHLLQARHVAFDHMHGGRIKLPRASPSSEQCVLVESTSFHEVHCDDRDPEELAFTYIY